MIQCGCSAAVGGCLTERVTEIAHSYIAHADVDVVQLLGDVGRGRGGEREGGERGRVRERGRVGREGG